MPLKFVIRRLDYLDLDDLGKYDLVILIFTDFGVLVPDDRSVLLSNIHRALKPGGCFLFDVLNENWPDQKLVNKTWEISEKDFGQIEFHENILPDSEICSGRHVTFCRSIRQGFSGLLIDSLTMRVRYKN